jgi:sugar diacid utilization regulator
VGGFEAGTPVLVEPSLKYHPDMFGVLTLVPYRDWVQCVVGSLTGAVSSQRVTEEHEGALSAVGHRAESVKAKARLTARPTSRAGTKVGLSDPVVLYGRAIAQRIKGTPGITG